MKHKISSAININLEQYDRFSSGDIHTDEFNLQMIDEYESKPIEPIIAGYGVQDKIDFGNFSIIWGFRLDYWNS